MSQEQSVIARCTSDDPDFDPEDLRELHIYPCNDGWIIDSVPPGEVRNQPVLFSHHGKLPIGALLLENAHYNIMHKIDPAGFPYRDDYMDLAAELDSWQKTYPNQLNKLSVPAFKFLSSEDDKNKYVTDEDLPEPKKPYLQILFGGNGDWYVSTMTREARDIRAVRLAMSGGASWHFPGLCSCIANLVRAINSPHMINTEYPPYLEVSSAVMAWRKKYPNKKFDLFGIMDQPESFLD